MEKKLTLSFPLFLSVEWMNSQDYIQRFALFGAMHDMQNVNPMNQLMGGDGRPNDRASSGNTLLASSSRSY